MSTCYANPDPQFQPALRLITGITRASKASVTTSFDHDYVTGTIIRFYIPIDCGMQQINGKISPITVTGTNTFLVDINSMNFDEFAIPVTPAWYQNTCSYVIPIGELNNQLTAAVQDVR
ncbi:MAG: hypothetical protein PHS34_08285 [Candidatus Omnitrophica bacterium]|nr:hypothetical protein [Candidatus Omnitrophota bacterium]